MFSALALSAALALTPVSVPVPVTAAQAVSAPSITFQRLEIADGSGQAVEIGIWSLDAPAQAGERRPLVVISHGNGGDFRSHEATARALANAGFVVAALTHTGDNWRDQSGATDVVRRPRQLSLLIDYMLTQWADRGAVDPERIGAFGFSAGGFTVLVAAGGQPDLSRMAGHCRDHPGFYDCRLIGAADGPHGLPQPGDWVHDSRIRAVVSAAPALGFTFTADGLASVRQPVQLWRATGDAILPSPFYAEPVRDGLPTPPEYHEVQGAGHFDFLPPCSERLAALAPMICAPTPGFDRTAFHAEFEPEVVAFFRRTLAVE